MDLLESAFLSKTQKLNKKRQEQLLKRVGKLLPEIESAYEKGDKEEVQGLLRSWEMPSQKEWRKNVHSLVLNSAKAGVLRAHVELMRMKELYEFNDYNWEVDVVNEGANYEVVFPKEAQEWIQKYGYEIGVITEETVRERIRLAVELGLKEGMRGRDLNQLILGVTQTWLGMSHAETIARTETAKMYNAGRIARWSDPELNGFVEALQYDAIVDTRTTDFCKKIDGKIISMSNSKAIAEYTPPNHFRCRATWIPVTQFEEWADDFPLDEKPPKGFQFEAPLPHLLKGKKEPLVQVKPPLRVNPALIRDPDIIRNLPDDDFRIAIINIDDHKLKLNMIQERAEKMLINDEVLNIDKGSLQFQWYGFNKDTLEGSFEAHDRKYKFHMTPAIEDDVYDLMDKLRYADVDKLEKVLDEYTKEFADSLAHLDVVRAFRDARLEVPVNVTMNKGLKKWDKTSTEREAYKIKEPPKTKNYVSATRLQNALGKGQEWLDDYMPPQYKPATGIRLRFQNDLDRAYALSNEGTIHFGRSEYDPAVIVHEVGHVLHSQSRVLNTLTHEWFMKRTENLTLPKGKKNGEPNIPDSFFNSYIGRIYGWEESHGPYYKAKGFTENGIYGQEVISMGLQAMYDDPARFYRQDKDHFLFIYSIMKGLAR